jgi:hypothetical protein
MNSIYPGDTLSTNINPVIAGYSSLGNIGSSYNFDITYSSLINISLLMPPSTKAITKFIYIQAYIKDDGYIDSCYIDIANILPNKINISLSPTDIEVQK